MLCLLYYYDCLQHAPLLENTLEYCKKKKNVLDTLYIYVYKHFYIIFLYQKSLLINFINYIIFNKDDIFIVFFLSLLFL
jgi:hypothetical protein